MIDLELRNEIFRQLTYMPDRGIFIWLKDGIHSREKAGTIAGWICGNGALQVQLRMDDTKYYLHRLAFVFMTRNWPNGVVDHINRDRTDNRWCNLRDTDQTQNLYNSKIRSDNTSGYKGIHWFARTNKWMVYIIHKGKQVHLGYFEKLEDAIEARKKAEEKYYD